MVVLVIYTMQIFSRICFSSNDQTRDVMMAASTIKKYLEVIQESKIQEVWKLQWNQVSTSSSNIDFHVFKEFLLYAQVMQKTKKGKEDEEDNLTLFNSVTEVGNEIPTWILRNLTPNQMEQIQK